MNLKIEMRSLNINKWDVVCLTNEQNATRMIDALDIAYPERDFRIVDENSKKYNL